MVDTKAVTQLVGSLREARDRSLAFISDLSDEQLQVPLLEVINPILWESGHIAYFAEFWILRHLYGEKPILGNADSLYDSTRIPHDDRWLLPLPTRLETLVYMDRQFAAVERHLHAGHAASPEAEYIHRLVLHHEDMHGEALIYTRQTLGYANPSLATTAAAGTKGGGSLPGDVLVPAGTYEIGARPNDGFVFDNEKWAHEIALNAYKISRAPVTNAEYAAFIDAGGYREREYWSDEGWDWLQRANPEHPLYWRKIGNAATGKWERRHFDRWVCIGDHEPVCHVNWFEASAYCAWAGRRLPSEAEWEVAATGGERRRYPWGNDPPNNEYANVDAACGGPVDVGALDSGDSLFGCRQMIGNIWEWTASPFKPYPGFVTDPYKEYSAPWFGTHKVLRGGAWSTRGRLVTARWRNFYRPHRRDIITGFRTCIR